MKQPQQDFDREITIFVACYDEEANIVRTLDTVVAGLPELGCTWEVIVIDDASHDNSAALVRKYIAEHPEYPIALVVREKNQGLAQNYIEGAFLGSGRYYKLVCGDNVETKEMLVSVLRHRGEADMVIPYCVDDSDRSGLRRLISRFYTFLVNLISGHAVRYYNGVGVHLRYNVMRWHTNYYGFSFQADMITRLLDQGMSYVEVPTVAKERVGGDSKALTAKNFLSVLHFFIDLLIRRIGRSRRSIRR